MSKRKGVSLDEKRTRMLQIFYEKREFFTLKEIEKIASKEKGIVLQSVKDVLQALVDDGLVRSDKIGTSVFFWAFPGENITSLERRIADANKRIVEAEFQLNKLNEEIAKEKENQGDAEKWKELSEEVEELKKVEESLKNQIAKYGDMDPEVIEKLSDSAKVYKTAANTWTDNIYAVQSWCKNKFNVDTKDLNKQFRISEDLDYVE